MSVSEKTKTDNQNGRSQGTLFGEMPEGYADRLKDKNRRTEEDLVWEAQHEALAPNREERFNRAAIDALEAKLATLKRRDEHFRSMRGDTTTLETDKTWESRVCPLGELEVEPPTPLVLDFLHPTGHTILFGMGDAGKGTLAAHYAVELEKIGLRTLIVDFENQGDEWKPRVTALGGSAITKDAIHYYTPQNGAAIWSQTEDIRLAAKSVRADFIIIDSITFACIEKGMSVNDPQAPVMYRDALNVIGVPVLSLAHVPKDAKEPKYPFGSIFWHNAARVTWRIEILSIVNTHGEGKDAQPSRTVTLTCCKRNGGMKKPKQVMEIIYQQGDGGMPINITSKPFRETQADRVAAVLKEATGALSTTEIARAYNEIILSEDSNEKELTAKEIGGICRRFGSDARVPRFAKEGDKWRLA